MSEQQKEMNGTERMEQLVDAYGLEQCLEMLAEVCELKAEHIAEHWQDMHLSKAWQQRARVLLTVAQTVGTY